MPVDHVDGGAPFGAAVGRRQVGLHDEAIPVLPEGVPHEARERARAGRFLEQSRLGIGDRRVRRIGSLLPRKSTSALRSWRVGRVILVVSGLGCSGASSVWTEDGSAGPLPSSGGIPSALGWKLFIDGEPWCRHGFRPMANALVSVPSTEKRSSDSSGATCAWARIAARNLRAMSVVSSRSRFFENTVGPCPGVSPVRC